MLLKMVNDENKNSIDKIDVENINEIDTYIKVIENEDIIGLKELIKNNNHENCQKNIVLEIYNKHELSSKRLQFIMKNCSKYLNISSTFIRQLFKNDNVNLLDIIFDNFKFFDNEFINKLLFYYKNKIPLSSSVFNQLISNKEFYISSTNNKDNQNIQNDSSFKYLLIAFEKKNIFMVKYVVEQGADINKTNENYETPFFYACERGNKTIVKYLVEQGANINEEKGNGETPLFYAIKSGNEIIVKYLVEQGADINKEIEYDDTPLLCACRSGNETIIKYLLEQGADIFKVNMMENHPYTLHVGKDMKQL